MLGQAALSEDGPEHAQAIADGAQVAHSVNARVLEARDFSDFQTRPGHAIGGNSGAMKGLRAHNYRVEIRPLPELDYPQAERDDVAQNKPMQAVFEALMALRLRA